MPRAPQLTDGARDVLGANADFARRVGASSALTNFLVLRSDDNATALMANRLSTNCASDRTGTTGGAERRHLLGSCVRNQEPAPLGWSECNGPNFLRGGLTSGFTLFTPTYGWRLKMNAVSADGPIRRSITRWNAGVYPSDWHGGPESEFEAGKLV